MKKNIWPIAALAIIIAMFILTIGVYELSSRSTDTYSSPTNNSSIDDNSTTSGTIVTATARAIPEKADKLNFSLTSKSPDLALGAFATTVDQEQVANWTVGKHNVSVVSIAADSCMNGASGTWKITLAGDGELRTFYVVEGLVAYTVNLSEGKESAPYSDPAYGSPAPVPALNLSCVIDSDQAWYSVNLTFSEDTDSVPSVAMTLKTIGNRSYWDLYDSTGEGIRIVRIDAVTGEIVKTASIGGR
ncbi:hypothetical protein [Methanocella sp. MCL-LM]|uniref:hypothetical protein n=1 Tax=Methanocella sp. MCL-LM TaxID=3412035 RepID=UPI003C764168